MTKSAYVVTERVVTDTDLFSVSNTPPISSAQYCSHLTYREEVRGGLVGLVPQGGG